MRRRRWELWARSRGKGGIVGLRMGAARRDGLHLEGLLRHAVYPAMCRRLRPELDCSPN